MIMLIFASVVLGMVFTFGALETVAAYQAKKNAIRLKERRTKRCDARLANVIPFTDLARKRRIV